LNWNSGWSAKPKTGPEIVLIGLLRDYADDIEQLGYVPRMWGESDQ